MSDESETSDPPYEVGYKKPPVHTRFRKGRSGNPKGRPPINVGAVGPRSKNAFVDMFLKEMDLEIPARVGDETHLLTLGQALVRQVESQALKGDKTSQRLLLTLQMAAEKERLAEVDANIQHVREYRARWRPGDLPHADHVDLCPITGAIRVRGPTTPDQLRAWEKLKGQIQEVKDFIAEVRNGTDPYPNPSKVIAFLTRRLGEYMSRVPDGWDPNENLRTSPLS